MNNWTTPLVTFTAGFFFGFMVYHQPRRTENIATSKEVATIALAKETTPTMDWTRIPDEKEEAMARLVLKGVQSEAVSLVGMDESLDRDLYYLSMDGKEVKVFGDFIVWSGTIVDGFNHPGRMKQDVGPNMAKLRLVLETKYGTPVKDAEERKRKAIDAIISSEDAE